MKIIWTFNRIITKMCDENILGHSIKSTFQQVEDTSFDFFSNHLRQIIQKCLGHFLLYKVSLTNILISKYEVLF